MKTDRTSTKHPLDISDMTDEELNSELEKGYIVRALDEAKIRLATFSEPQK